MTLDNSLQVPPNQGGPGALTPNEAAMLEANAIRAEAGIPDHEPVGVQSGVSPGLSDSTVLSDDADLAITSETDASGAASSGTGTKSDPYVIRDKLMNNGNAIGVEWNDPDASYYCKFVNIEASTYGTAQIRIETGSKAVIENCLLYANTGAGYALRADAGAVDVRKTEFAGQGTTSGQDGIFAASTGRVRLRNCSFTASQEAWNGYRGVEWGTDDARLDARYIDVTAPGMNGLLRVGNQDTHLDLWNIHVSADTYLIDPDYGTSGTFKTCTVKFCRIDGGKNIQLIAAGEAEGKEIGYCEVLDPNAGNRGIYTGNANGKLTTNLRIHHNKVRTVNGTGAGNEGINARAPRNVEYDHNWVPECSEDALEMIYSIRGNEIHHNVVDNVTGQGVDIYRSRSSDGTEGTDYTASTTVHHIYGDTGMDGVLVTDASDVRVTGHIFLKTPANLVEFEQRNGTTGVATANCRAVGPFSKPESVGGDLVAVVGDTGGGHWAVWYENGDKKTLGSPPSTEVV